MAGGEQARAGWPWRFDSTGITAPEDEAEREAIRHRDWLEGMATEAWERDDPEGFLAAQPKPVRRRIEAARYGAAYKPSSRLGRNAMRVVWAVRRTEAA